MPKILNGFFIIPHFAGKNNRISLVERLLQNSLQKIVVELMQFGQTKRGHTQKPFRIARKGVFFFAASKYLQKV